MKNNWLQWWNIFSSRMFQNLYFPDKATEAYFLNLMQNKQRFPTVASDLILCFDFSFEVHL